MVCRRSAAYVVGVVSDAPETGFSYMPIKLIRAISERLQKDKSSDRKVAGSSKKNSVPAKGAFPALSGKPAEVWHPGDKSNKEESEKPSSTKKTNSSRSSKKSSAASRPKSAAKPSAGNGGASTGTGRKSRGGKGRSRSKANTSAPNAEQTRETKPVEKTEASNWTREDFKVEPKEGKTRFHDVDLPVEILHAVADLGFEYCTPVQARVLTEVSQGHNVAGKAQTGTGKTAAFLMLTFKQFLESKVAADRPLGRPRALVLAPTRELVIQLARDAKEVGKYCNMRYVALYGGADYDRQEKALQEGPVDLIAATPGRLLDFCRKRIVNLRDVEVLIIDEADRMLDMGFIPDVKTIIRQTPPKDKRRTLLFSATLSDDVMRLASQWMPDPHIVEIEPEQVAVDTVKQLVYMVRANEKFKVLYNLINRPNVERILIFTNRRDQADRVAGELTRYGIDCALLSGAVDQNKRMKVLDAFRAGSIKVVVATDVAGRGLHVDGINHVVNFDLPYEAEDYVHRIGRTGRAGAEGTAVSFACEDESFTIPEIEKYIGEDLACKYPEDVLLRALPKTDAPPYRRKPRGPNTGGGGRSGGARGGPRRSGGRRSSSGHRSGPPRRRS